MLAYVFWHRPKPGVDARDYEQAQRAFHASLQRRSACFRLARLPFTGEAGYEDWYLVEDWESLGRLNELAVDPLHAPGHDRVATLAAEGWGAVYELVRGDATIPVAVEWIEKPRGEPSGEFVASLPHDDVWRRQLVLGPAPEFCCSVAASDTRTPI
jgi:hypothetical protein